MLTHLQRSLKSHPGLPLALAFYLALASTYFFIVPIFEAPDEWTHTGHVKYIAEGNGLPVMLPGQGIWGGQQPPLYYSIGAVLVQPFDLDGVADYEENRRNPHAAIGYALDPGNKNNYLHTPGENFPYQGLALTVHVLRLYSITLGLIGLVFSYLTAYDLFAHISGNERKAKQFATAVALFIAFQPMYAFITASVANENANIATAAVALWVTQRYVLHGPQPSLWRPITLGLFLGLIALSKMTGLAFGLVAVVAMLQIAVRSRREPGAAWLIWRDGVIIGLGFLIVGGWWYWRNYQLYGDFFQVGMYKLYFDVDPQPISMSDFLYTLSTGEISFWATFGWLNIVGPEWIYSVYRIVSRAGLIGLLFAALVGVYHIINRSSTAPPTSQLSPLLIHLLFPVVMAFSLTRLVAIEGGLQGRQLLPALGSMAIVIVWGWWALTTVPIRQTIFLTVGVLLFAIAAWLPFGVVAPEFIPSRPLTEAQLPSDLTRLDWIYNDDLKLLGVEIEATDVRPGDRVPVTAYWQALRPIDTDYSVFVHLIGRGYTNNGQLNSYPALGLRPTTTLEPGQIIKDVYPVLVDGGSRAPTRLLVNIGLFDFREAGRPGLPATTADGDPVGPTVDQLKLAPSQWPAVDDAPLATFDDGIRLVNARLTTCPATCDVELVWQAVAHPSSDYTAFVQLWPDGDVASEQPFYGFDGPPLNNDYPTSLWAANEVVTDPRQLDLSQLPSGRYRVLVGLYDPNSGARLPAYRDGQPLTDFAVDVGVIVIE